MFYKKILFLTYALLNICNNSYAFMNPSIKLKSGKSATLYGSGPPSLLCTGLFSVMPGFLYSDLIKLLQKNSTLITINDYKPLVKNDIEDLCNTLNVDKIMLIGHSSFNPDVLNSDYIAKAVLMDPINIPKISFISIDNHIINVDYDLHILKAEFLYNNNNNNYNDDNNKEIIPSWQTPIINGKNVYEEIILDSGHPDILDNIWANFAKKYGFWKMMNTEKICYKDYNYNKKNNNNINVKRDAYRKYMATKILESLNL